LDPQFTWRWHRLTEDEYTEGGNNNRSSFEMQSLASLVRDSLDTQRTYMCVEGTISKGLACHGDKS